VASCLLRNTITKTNDLVYLLIIIPYEEITKVNNFAGNWYMKFFFSLEEISFLEKFILWV
jgi:hypothetical protein